MSIISIEFSSITILILIIFIINISHILYLIINKNNQFFRLILLNISFSSIIIAIWLIPLFYFRTVWSSESTLWRIWSYLYHIVDAVQLYSLLLLITNTHTINSSLQRFFICLSWIAPVITYSPLLWLTSPYDKIDYLPYRRLTINIPWWILPILYSCMYLVPLFISFIFTTMTICWSWVSNRYKKRDNHVTEHRENMAELTSLIETVLNFELEQSTIGTLNTWIPSISSLANPSTNTDQTSLSYISNKLNRSLSYKASQDRSLLLFDELSSNNCIEKQQTHINYCLLCIIICLLFLVHLPYVILSVMDIYISQLPIFIYIHWFGTMFIPIIHFKKN